MIHSNIWIFIIVFGAGLFAFANIQFNYARERENKISMSYQTIALLRPELKRNYTYLTEQISRLNEGKEIMIELESNFETEAWQTVSNSDLLLGLETERLSDFIQAYYLMNRFNALQSKSIKATIGLEQALSGNERTKALIDKYLIEVLKELEPILEKFKPIIESVAREKSGETEKKEGNVPAP